MCSSSDHIHINILYFGFISIEKVLIMPTLAESFKTSTGELIDGSTKTKRKIRCMGDERTIETLKSPKNK